ncbi:MAG: hypothetical protein ACMXYK_02960, partial [Candidatus Woesearchaeota archaeon]
MAELLQNNQSYADLEKTQKAFSHIKKELTDIRKEIQTVTSANTSIKKIYLQDLDAFKKNSEQEHKKLSKAIKAVSDRQTKLRKDVFKEFLEKANMQIQKNAYLKAQFEQLDKDIDALSHNLDFVRNRTDEIENISIGHEKTLQENIKQLEKSFENIDIINKELIVLENTKKETQANTERLKSLETKQESDKKFVLDSIKTTAKKIKQDVQSIEKSTQERIVLFEKELQKKHAEELKRIELCEKRILEVKTFEKDTNTLLSKKLKDRKEEVERINLRIKKNHDLIVKDTKSLEQTMQELKISVMKDYKEQDSKVQERLIQKIASLQTEISTLKKAVKQDITELKKEVSKNKVIVKDTTKKKPTTKKASQ